LTPQGIGGDGLERPAGVFGQRKPAARAAVSSFDRGRGARPDPVC